MRYIPPVDETGKEYYVPVVSKNRDTLIGHLQGVYATRDMMVDVFKAIGIDMELDSLEPMLDSTRFNDILSNGKHESEMSADDLKEFVFDLFEEITIKTEHKHEENDTSYSYVLNIECTCGLGFYSWETYNDIPTENFECCNCGKVLIHYTGDYDHEYEYDDGGKDDTEKD